MKTPNNEQKPSEKVPQYFESSKSNAELGIPPQTEQKKSILLNIVKVTPLILNPKGGQEVHIVFASPSKILQKQGNCRFGKNIVPAGIAGEEFLCISPPSNKSVYVSISLDGQVWAPNDVLVCYQAPLSAKQIIFDIVACIVVFSGVPSAIKPYICPKKKSNEFDIQKDGEDVPLTTAKEQLFDNFA
ncbi:hypothetical protein TVAG_136570 [Trichomonas vaginalis G3]|uniref:IPT/TIG domain-containing protein n=1 Tax=Trichomonas vaginalis (strain ATCC PRA-98 / G3) TaxID=412133 RepID=A2DJD9_TRIV3|nr:immunoglobulins domain-containing protein [Trichomonas vaginalis G3]EAY19526.1 hypothetical protein TVAG_136570 [Trichomonas vaginalis G3]KAI5519992.1 immunoglobulins domain-containing protein [Trichomonas vaginalis G3]|eukprot:XP_001580512.1 hypothetical protein [Trichomonas vaginalis G3]